jgi:hypothetical protein
VDLEVAGSNPVSHPLTEAGTVKVSGFSYLWPTIEDESMTAKTYTLAALIVFAILGAVDFIQTYTLVQRSGGQVYESNPLAATWLKDYGWYGLAVFKAGTTLVVATIVLILRRKKPRVAAVIATTAFLSVLAVAIYSRNLLTQQEDSSSGKQIIPEKIENE